MRKETMSGYLALARAEAQKRQHSRRGKLLPARRTLFQNYVVEQNEIVVKVSSFQSVAKTPVTSATGS